VPAAPTGRPALLCPWHPLDPGGRHDRGRHCRLLRQGFILPVFPRL